MSSILFFGPVVPISSTIGIPTSNALSGLYDLIIICIVILQPNVYILLLENDEYYIGSSSNTKRRFGEHLKRNHSGTKYKKPIKILFTQTFTTYSEARRVEMRLKRLKSKKILTKIIESGKITLKYKGL